VSLLRRGVKEILVAPGEHHGVGASGAEPASHRSGDVRAPAQHDDGLGMSEGVFDGYLPVCCKRRARLLSSLT
jgi:hypothetical protein